MREALLGSLVALIGLIGMIEGVRLSWFQSNAVFRNSLGGGYFVMAISAAVVISGMMTAISAWREAIAGQSPPDHKPESRSVVLRVVATTGICVGYVLFIHFVGYLISTAAFCLIAFRIAGVKSWSVIAALSLVLSVAFYLVFVKLGGIQFPSGLLTNFPDT